MIGLYIIYILNIIVAGQIAISSIFNPKNAAKTIFQNAYQQTDVIRLVGCLWLSIAVISVLGLWKPLTFSIILLVQLIYKGTWLFVVALPAYQKKTPFPRAMSVFFIIWIILLPFIIPWTTWFQY